MNSHRSILTSEGMIPGPSGTVFRRSHRTVGSNRSATTDPFPPLPSDLPMPSADYVASIKRFACQPGFSSTGDAQLPFFREKFRPVDLQARWNTYEM